MLLPQIDPDPEPRWIGLVPILCVLIMTAVLLNSALFHWAWEVFDRLAHALNGAAFA